VQATSAESRHLLQNTRDFLARELRQTLEQLSSARERTAQKSQAVQSTRLALQRLAEHLARLEGELEADHATPVPEAEQQLLQESREDLVQEILRLRAEQRRRQEDERRICEDVQRLRVRLAEADLQHIGERQSSHAPAPATTAPLDSTAARRMLSPEELRRLAASSLERTMKAPALPLVFLHTTTATFPLHPLYFRFRFRQSISFLAYFGSHARNRTYGR
jgi:hypothetical protein